MKKRMWLLLLLIVFSSMDVIGMDQLRMQTSTAEFPDQSGASDVRTQPETLISEELQLFPIPKSLTHPDYQAVFEDSWMSERTYGGERGHEGTDIMLYPDQRGLFPVLSMTDGIVEKKGWLPRGGYRLGIRSAGGIYYYYAHLYDYAEGIKEGTRVAAGQLLGFAGDSGYSNIEGTVGNFPVHLHVGIYYNNDMGEETAVNPYPFLLPLPTVTMEY